MWGMRMSLPGTQASREGESPTQDANVAEADHGEPVSGESEDRNITSAWR